MAVKPLTARQVWKLEDWTTRLLTLGVLLVAALAAVNIAVWLAVGALGGDWQLSRMSDSLTWIILAMSWTGWVYWKRRAKEAEKHPTAFEHSWSPATATNVYINGDPDAVAERLSKLSPNARHFIR